MVHEHVLNWYNPFQGKKLKVSLCDILGFHYSSSTFIQSAVEYLKLFLRDRKFARSFLLPDTAYSDGYVSWFYSVPQG